MLSFKPCFFILFLVIANFLLVHLSRLHAVRPGRRICSGKERLYLEAWRIKYIYRSLFCSFLLISAHISSLVNSLSQRILPRFPSAYSSPSFILSRTLKMRSIAVLLVLATTAVVSGSPINNTNLTGSHACSGYMDGRLPYYQPQGFKFSGNIRRYYIAAEIDTWNYAPSGMYRVSSPLISIIRVLN